MILCHMIFMPQIVVATCVCLLYLKVTFYHRVLILANFNEIKIFAKFCTRENNFFLSCSIQSYFQFK